MDLNGRIAILHTSQLQRNHRFDCSGGIVDIPLRQRSCLSPNWSRWMFLTTGASSHQASIEQETWQLRRFRKLSSSINASTTRSTSVLQESTRLVPGCSFDSPKMRLEGYASCLDRGMAHTESQRSLPQGLLPKRCTPLTATPFMSISAVPVSVPQTSQLDSSGMVTEGTDQADLPSGLMLWWKPRSLKESNAVRNLRMPSPWRFTTPILP